MHKDLKENSLPPSLFHFHPSIPRLSWLSRVSTFHWPLGGCVWKNKLRRKGREQRTTSSNTEERCADAAAATWAFALIMDGWCRRFASFSQAETEKVSLTLECGRTVSDLCQVNQEKKRETLCRGCPPTACQRPHTTHIKHVLLTWPSTLPLSDTGTQCGQRHCFWLPRSEYSPVGRAEWLRTDGGV